MQRILKNLGMHEVVNVDTMIVLELDVDERIIVNLCHSFKDRGGAFASDIKLYRTVFEPLFWNVSTILSILLTKSTCAYLFDVIIET